MAKKEQKGQGVKLAIRQAGEGGISKEELNNIVKTTGASAQTVIRRLDSVNQSLKSKDKTGINLNSGAANMLIKEAGPAYGGFYGLTQKPTFGTGRIGQALEGMRGTRASGGYINPQSGTGSVTPATDRRFMMGGTAIRPGGRETVRGFGQQYTYKGGNSKPYNGMKWTGQFDPNGPGPLAKPNPQTWTGNTGSGDNNTNTGGDNNIDETVIPTDQQGTDAITGQGMMSGGGLGALGANKLGRAKSRLQRLGIKGRGTGLLGRGLQYGNSLNIGR
jgi:hypothetical protein